MKFAIPFLIVLCTLNGQCRGGDWSYDEKTGPNQWPAMYPTCNGIRQTPIDIDTFGMTCTEKSKVLFLNYKTPISSPKIQNNGHTVLVNGTSSSQVITNFNGITEIYNFAHFHLHWGSDDRKGSEHTIDGQTYPMELHMVHTNVRYPTDYVNRTNGIAVVGIFFQITNRDNPALSPLIASFPKILNANSQTNLPANSVKLSSFMPSRYVLPLFTYQGSLTTPTCNEAVTWLVLRNSIGISRSQMQRFRTLKDSSGKPMVNNFRPVQDLNDRSVGLCLAKGTMIDANVATSGGFIGGILKAIG